MAFDTVLRQGRVILTNLTRVDTAVIMRKSHISDGGGGQTDTYASAGSVRCSFVRFPVRPLEHERSPVVEAFNEWRFNFDRDVVIRQTDRIVCQGRTFEVIGQGIGSVEMSNRVICEEIL